MNDPLNGVNASGPAKPPGAENVTVGATDNVGVSKVEWYLNNTLMGSSASASASFAWNTTTYANGSYTLQTKAYDAAGNVGSSAMVSVTVQNSTLADTTAPTITIARGSCFA